MTFFTSKKYTMITCSIFACTTILFASTALASSWGYAGIHGPKYWGNEYTTCANSKTQSPINIIVTKTIANKQLLALNTNFTSMPLELENNGHTIKVSTTKKNTFSTGKFKYYVEQFHFHSPSENELNGKKFPMEMHIVGKTKDGKIAVIAVFIAQGKTNALLNTILSHANQQVSKQTLFNKTQINLNKALPKHRGYYFYHGSFTTPPCTENVNWYVLKSPIHASKLQIQQFRKLYWHNARPVQPLNGRIVERY